MKYYHFIITVLIPFFVASQPEYKIEKLKAGDSIKAQIFTMKTNDGNTYSIKIDSSKTFINMENKKLSYEEAKRLIASGDYYYSPVFNPQNMQGDIIKVLKRSFTQNDYSKSNNTASQPYMQLKKGDEVITIPLNEKSVYRDTSGAIIPFDEAKRMLDSKEYSISPYVNKQLNRPTGDLMVSYRGVTKSKIMVGDLFPELDKLSFKDVSGITYTPDKLKNKILVLNFWFKNCAPCRMEIPALNNIADKFENNEKVKFIALNPFDNNQIINGFLAANEFHYICVGKDSIEEFVTKGLGITTFPTNMIVGKDGKIHLLEIGYDDSVSEKIEKKLEELLSPHQ